MQNQSIQDEKTLKTEDRKHGFFSRARWSTFSPSTLLRRKSLVKSGTLVGAAVGIVVFFVLAIMVNMHVIPLPGLTTQVDGGSNSTMTIIIGVLLGAFIGAAGGALVGAGTPVPLSDPKGSLGR